MSDAGAMGDVPAGAPLLDRLRWYRDRLAAMSAQEMLFRVREQALRRVTRQRPPLPAAVLRRDSAGLPALPGLLEGVGELAAVDGGPLARWEADAAALRDGTIRRLGYQWLLEDGVPGWHRDPVSGRRWPVEQWCFDIPYRESRILGDVRFAWELGRLQHLQPLAALAAVGEDRGLAAAIELQVLDFLAHNPPGRGVHWATGLEVALRTVSLSVVASLLGPGMLSPDGARRLRDALAAHGAWLMRFPSLHSSANHHLVAEAAALFLLGALLPGLRPAARWSAFARHTLEAQAVLQVHGDGVPAEQSLGLGVLTLECLLLADTVARRLDQPLAPAVADRLVAAAGFLRAVADAGGHLPALGDDDGSRALACTDEPGSYAASVGASIASAYGRPDLTPPNVRPSLRHALFGLPQPVGAAALAVRRFAEGGYTAVREVDQAREHLLLFDHGPLGYLSIAAHGHADALSVWLHVDGRPVLVDAGTFAFHAGGPWRAHFRGSAAHNTLTVDGEDSSAQAGPFNWSRKARSELHAWDGSPGAWHVEASHDGYLAAYGYRHRRRVERLGPGVWQIADRLEGEGGVVRVEIGFLLAPDLTVGNVSGGFVVSEGNRRLLFIRHEGPLKGWLERGLESPRRGWHAPRLGRREPAPRLVFAGKLWHGVAAKFTLSTRFA